MLAIGTAGGRRVLLARPLPDKRRIVGTPLERENEAKVCFPRCAQFDR